MFKPSRDNLGVIFSFKAKMNNVTEKVKNIFRLDESPKMIEVDHVKDKNLAEEIYKNFLNSYKLSNHNIDLIYHVKREKNDFHLKGALIYHNGKQRLFYLEQKLLPSHVHGTLLSGMFPDDEVLEHISADTYPELAHHLEKYFLVDNPDKIANGHKKAKVKINNTLGMHARPSASFIQTCAKYSSKIYVRNIQNSDRGGVAINGNNYVNGKSIMEVMTLSAEQGNELELLVKGADSKQAIISLTKLVQSGFGEY